jgi:hypothetical protein
MRPPSPCSRIWIEVLVAHLPEDLVAQDAGIGDHDVEPAELVDGALDQRLRRRRVADRGDLDDGPSAGGGDRVDGLAGRRLVDVVDDDGGARRGERDRVRAPEAASAPGDDGDLAVEVRRGAHA